MKTRDPSANSALFGSDLWQAALEKYAIAARLTVTLFDLDGHVVIGPVHPTPLFQLFDEAGYDPGIFGECSRRCIAQAEKRPAVVLSQFHGLAVVGASLALEGRIVGAAVGGYAFADFSQVSEIQRLAKQSGIVFDRVWKIARKQPPVPQQRLVVYGELLQVLGDALLRENHRTRQYEQAAAIVNSSDEAIISRDCNGVITSWNNGAERLFGYPAQEVIGKPITMLIPPDRQQEEAEFLARIMRGEHIDHFETIRVRKDGAPLEISLTMSPIKDSAGYIIGASKIARDITDRKRHERERGTLSAIVDSSFDAIIGHTLEGTITHWNRAAEDMFGYQAADIIGRPMSALFPPGRVDEAAALSTRIGQGEVMVSFDSELMRKDQTEIAVALTVSPVKDEGGRIVAASTIASDVTERKKMEEHQTLLLHELSHRVKNTLATVQAITAQTLRAGGVAPPTRAALEDRLIALAHAHDVLLEQNWGSADLREIAGRVLDAFMGTSGGRLRLEGRPVHVAPKAALALAMALHELATNASKYGALSNDTGDVNVSWSVRGKSPPVLSLRWRESGGPPVTPPSHQGFGSRMLKRNLAEELGGEVEVSYPRDGVVCTIDFPLGR